MKLTLALVFVSAASLSMADDLSSARTMMRSAMNELGSHEELSIVVTGLETDGDKETEIRMELAVRFSLVSVGDIFRQVAQLELLSFRDKELMYRVAADGDRYWHYDLAKRQYTSTDYGTAKFVGQERSRMFKNLSVRSQGVQTFLSRLMADAFVSNFADGNSSRSAWLPWRPNSTVTVNGSDVVCDSGIPSQSKLTYILEPGDRIGHWMKGATYFEQSTISGRKRTVRWQAVIFRGKIPRDTSFEFVPPPGSRAVSVAEAGGG
ncbi:MAG: hypothetical protein IH945_04940 [Armatimonadetes bacterium]|nr:hypothetical protein [Armatimonadota bacterium]